MSAAVPAPISAPLMPLRKADSSEITGLRKTQAGFQYKEHDLETLLNGFTLDIPEGCFPLSTDSMLLGWFVRLPKSARVLDLGSGCGTLGLLLCAREEKCRVTGIELTEQAHRAALANIARNGLEDRMESICADVRQVPSLLSPGSFTTAVSNPPYFSGGPRSAALPIARREDCCTVRELLQSAAWALKYGGDLFLVHRPERLGEIVAQAGSLSLEAKELCLVRHRPGGPIILLLLRLRKGGKPGLIFRELTLTDENGQPSKEYKSIYHIE